MKTLTRREAISGMFRLAGVTALAGAGCAVNPVTGKRQLMLMSENKEIRMGMQAHDDIVKSYGSYPDDSMQSWFDERGQEIGGVAQGFPGIRGYGWPVATRDAFGRSCSRSHRQRRAG